MVGDGEADERGQGGVLEPTGLKDAEVLPKEAGELGGLLLREASLEAERSQTPAEIALRARQLGEHEGVLPHTRPAVRVATGTAAGMASSTHGVAST